MKIASSVYDYDVINDSWFLTLKMNRYLAASFSWFQVLEKQKLIKVDRPSKTKIKVSFTAKKVLYLKESFKFQSKGCVSKKVLYYFFKKKYYKGPSIKYVRTIWWFSDTPPSLYAFKRLNDVINSIDVRFCLAPSLPHRAYVLYE